VRKYIALWSPAVRLTGQKIEVYMAQDHAGEYVERHELTGLALELEAALQAESIAMKNLAKERTRKNRLNGRRSGRE
jgi:hypothetical protein